jgi:hypothetical protein
MRQISSNHLGETLRLGAAGRHPCLLRRWVPNGVGVHGFRPTSIPSRSLIMTDEKAWKYVGDQKRKTWTYAEITASAEKRRYVG